MNFDLTDEQKNFVNEVDAFCKAYCDNVDIAQLEESGKDAEEIEQKLVKKGWYGLPFSKEYGGAGRKLFDFGLLIEGLFRGGYPWPGRLSITMLNAMNISENGTDEQKRNLLPKIIKGEITLSISATEPNAGSDIASLTTKAIPKDGGYSITGQKVFSSGAAGERNIIVVAARTDFNKARHKGLTLFLVPSRTKGVEFRRLSALGRRVGGLYEVFFDDAWIPEENILGGLNNGWATLTSGFNVERAIGSACYLGFAERIFLDILPLSERFTVENKRVGNYGAVAQRIADAAVELQAAKLLTYKALSMVDGGRSAVLEVSQSKVYCSELVQRLGDLGIELSGGVGLLMNSRLQWYFRESRIVTVGGGSSQIMRNVAGATLGLKQR